MQVCPSILEQKVEDYFLTLKKLSPYSNYFQLDFTDGFYVENKTADFDVFLNQITNHQSLVANLIFDFHLMIRDYEKIIEKLEKIKETFNIKSVFIHFDLSPKNSVFNKKYSLPIGLVLNPQDQVHDLTNQYNLLEISAIQIMSVVPGAQGKPFIPDTLNKIEQLRLSDYRNKIYLDGGINEATLPLIKSLKYQPDVICPGSFLTKTKELKNHFELLSQMSS